MQFLMYVFAGLFEFFLVRFQRFSAYCVASLIQALPMSICLSVCLSVYTAWSPNWKTRRPKPKLGHG